MSESNRGSDRQVEIFMEGMAGVTPDVPPSFEELEEAALAAMDEKAYGYVAGGAGGERTIGHNRDAFAKWRLWPRMLRDYSERDLSTELFGTELSVPALLAPIGVQSIIHEEGELGVARAAADLDVPMVVSSAASHTMEEIAEELGDTPGWFQLYWSSNDDVARSFVSRAEAAGYEALVVTLDNNILGWRERDIRDGYLPFLDGEGVANYFSDEAFRDLLDAPPEEAELSAIRTFIDIFGDPSLTFDDLEWLCEYADIPVVVKGVLHPDDARECIERGAEGVIVSNHGGRQVDNAVTALDVLPRIVSALDDDVPVLFDSGIRRGSDALVALALGADAVGFGRPYAYGLAIDGENGVESVVKNFLADLDLTLGLIGYDDVDDVDREAVVRANEL
ncbi:alpha-hydroxy-acid oxidizing protein [Natronomonas sp. CBA1123]|jgi:isopentenyl-diphosphate delta-isomerase|uniref:alpha-hydroxy-acid oxidizing protein n=1 Tax=Natronomonas sp. CBA1123 TaxID=2668070 RepID=UPI0012EAFD30|nr:alpha-hydroxy-acid oxidizing protein [Natronomonas sp. CBA1123]MUV86158.1 alpha-hydroxy-acid oxidizing protein [Natronomonas sp. CBA1123]